MNAEIVQGLIIGSLIVAIFSFGGPWVYYTIKDRRNRARSIRNIELMQKAHNGTLAEEERAEFDRVMAVIKARMDRKEAESCY